MIRRRRMTHATLIAVALAVALAGCHKNLTFETPKTKVAYTADQILKRVGELQNAVITAEASTPKGIQTRDARLILTACGVLDRILVAAPSGWKTAAVIGAWSSARTLLKTLPENLPGTWQEGVRQVWSALVATVPVLGTNVSVQAIWASVDAVLGGY